METVWLVLKRVLQIVGISVLCLMIWVMYGLVTSGSRVRDKCSQITGGITFSELKIFAISEGFLPPSNPPGGSGEVAIAEGRSYGRAGCKVTLEAGLVKSVKYYFMD